MANVETHVIEGPRPGNVVMMLCVKDPNPIVQKYGIRDVKIYDKTTKTWVMTIEARRDVKDDLCEDDNVDGLEFDGIKWKDTHPYVAPKLDPHAIKAVEKLIGSNPQLNARYVASVSTQPEPNIGIPVRCEHTIKVYAECNIQTQLVDDIAKSIACLPIKRTLATVSNLRVTEKDCIYFVSYTILYGRKIQSPENGAK